jgi:branched-chain amino acid aminotransferase
VYLSEKKIGPSLLGVESDFLMYGINMEDYLNPGGISCRFSSWTRQEDRSVPLRAKIAGSYTVAAMAKAEAMSSGFDEALILNSQGKVCEASAMNLFVVRSDELITPGVNEDILEGITRDSVITIARDNGIKVVVRSIDKTELLIADEVFITGTAGKVTSVNRIENYNLSSFGKISSLIKEKYEQVLAGQNPKYESWNTRIKI